MIAIFTEDLLLKSRIKTLTKEQIHFFTDPAKYPSDARLIIVDLSMPGAIELLKSTLIRRVAYGPHMQADLLAKSKETGAEVMPRSVFVAKLPELLS
ncbi:hypothetical protein HY641_01695 [Candidatus Woesearchaeota archaeon]|nr:hypothetical protein [Candidatus Woesearchaeota archaeon]